MRDFLIYLTIIITVFFLYSTIIKRIDELKMELFVIQTIIDSPIDIDECTMITDHLIPI